MTDSDSAECVRPVRTGRILYIDDDPAIRRLVQRDLERHGLTVVLAESGAQGLAHAAAGGFDVICLDHYMPGQDGLETLVQLQSHPDAPPIIFVTGSDEGRIAVAALRAGAVDYVIKDAGGEFLTLLRATLNDVLDTNALRRQAARALQDLQQAREQAENLAAQRALLLQEVNHRVANSLQLIASLALLHERSITDPATRAVMADMRARIFAVAQVHQRLYTSDDVRVVALDEYLGGLIKELERSIAATRHLVITFEAEPLSLSTDKAVPLGLIVTELVTNAIKYAYAPDTSGEIRVRLQCSGGQASLWVEDDGVGISASAAQGARSGTGLGANIVTAMAESIGAVVERKPAARGTIVGVQFPTMPIGACS